MLQKHGILQLASSSVSSGWRNCVRTSCITSSFVWARSSSWALSFSTCIFVRLFFRRSHCGLRRTKSRRAAINCSASRSRSIFSRSSRSLTPSPSTANCGDLPSSTRTVSFRPSGKFCDCGHQGTRNGLECRAYFIVMTTAAARSGCLRSLVWMDHGRQ